MRGRQLRQEFLIGTLLLVAFWLTTLIWSLVGKAQLAVNEAHKAQRQYEALETRKSMLEGNLAALETARGKDAAIRSAFGVARPGEEVIVVVPPKPVATTTDKTWWQKILNWLK